MGRLPQADFNLLAIFWNVFGVLSPALSRRTPRARLRSLDFGLLWSGRKVCRPAIATLCGSPQEAFVTCRVILCVQLFLKLLDAFLHGQSGVKTQALAVCVEGFLLEVVLVVYPAELLVGIGKLVCGHLGIQGRQAQIVYRFLFRPLRVGLFQLTNAALRLFEQLVG